MEFSSVLIIPQDQLIIIDNVGLYTSFKYPEEIIKIEYKYQTPEVVYYYNKDGVVTEHPKEELTYFVHIWETEKSKLDSNYKIDKQSQERLIEYYSSIIQTALDNFAKTRRYDSIMSVCSYYNSTNDRFRKEAEYCTKLRDDTWDIGYQILDEVLAGIRDIPTEEELVVLLPVFEAKWPN